MRALSVRQPWAGLIVAGLKDIENRSWRTEYRGQLLVHASLGRSGRTLSDIERMYCIAITDGLVKLCTLTGGVIGAFNVVDCVSESTSPWFDGPINDKGKRNFGLVLRNARKLPFCPMPGRLGLFPVTPNVATQIATGLLTTGQNEAGAQVGGRAKIINDMGLFEIGP